MEARKTALSGLERSAFEARPRDVELGDDLAVEPHAALLDFVVPKGVNGIYASRRSVCEMQNCRREVSTLRC